MLIIGIAGLMLEDQLLKGAAECFIGCACRREVTEVEERPVGVGITVWGHFRNVGLSIPHLLSSM